MSIHSSSKLLSQPISKRLNGILEILKILGTPVRVLIHGTRNTARKTIVEHIVLAVAIVASNACAKAFSRERNARFANDRRAIVAVRVAPDAIHLRRALVVTHHSMNMEKSVQLKSPTHKLLPTDDSHNTQRLQPMILRMEIRVPSLVAKIAKDNIRDEVGIEIGNFVVRVLPHLALESGGGLRVVGVSAASISVLGLVAIAVDVHVREFAAFAVEIEHARIIILAVRKCWVMDALASIQLHR